jgi:hypothetical protein
MFGRDRGGQVPKLENRRSTSLENDSEGVTGVGK